jgi:hypothetical protein
MALLCMDANAQRFVTGMVDTFNETIGAKTNEFAVLGPHETLELVSSLSARGTRLQIVKDGTTFDYGHGDFFNSGLVPGGTIPQQPPLIITGPLVARVYTPTNGNGFWTVKITPDRFPPDKTITLAPGDVATVALETSTDLLHWRAIAKQTVSATNGAQFFRVRADRVQ